MDLGCSSLVRRTPIATAAAIGLGAVLAVPAGADMADGPCPLTISFLCGFVPIAPDLDHDVDLTTHVPASDPAASPADALPHAEVCVDGCS